MSRPQSEACGPAETDTLHRAVTQTGAPGTGGRQAAAIEIVRLLLAAGADPSITNKSGKKPADYVRDAMIMSLIKKR
jgi:hypothetical protein